MFVLTAFHVLTGTIAVLAGAVAALTRKGGGVHIRAGKAFVVLMTLSSLLGAALGLIKFETFFITFFAGILGAYLVVSGWLSVHRSATSQVFMDRALTTANAVTCFALIAIGTLALTRSDGAMFGFAGENYLFLAVMSGIAAIADISRLFRRSLSRNHIVARHLWRMLLGFFIAAGSAFTGPGSSIFPAAIQASGILSLPELLILVLMIFYLVKTIFFSPSRPTR